jgi:hypothetical protein
MDTKLSKFVIHVNAISSSITVLLELVKPLQSSSCEPISSLASDLETFHYSLVLLSYQVLHGDNNCNKQYQDWCDVSRLTDLLENAQACFARMEALLLNGMRSEFYSVKKYLFASGSGGEMVHLCLRLRIYTTAMSNPLLLSAV